jgi:hypothetical protein
MVRVLMTATSYPLAERDWRGRFILDMASGLGRRGDLEMALWAPPGPRPPGVSDALRHDDGEWLLDLMRSGGIAHGLRAGGKSALAAASLLRRLWRGYRQNGFDVAHVNWLQNALPLWGLKRPAVITVLGTDYALLRLPGMKTALRLVLKQAPAILAPNAAWMQAGLVSAFGDVAEVRPVPFGVDKRWYEIDRSEARPGVWLAVTRLTRAKLGSLLEWGQGLFGNERVLHLFGPMQEEINLPPWVNWHGPTNPEELASRWFPHATGLVSLSRHDEGRPQVLLEAMAAGLPVVVSNLAAHRDFVQHGQTGYLVEERGAFEAAVAELDNRSVNKAIGEAARAWVKSTLGDWDDCAARYVAAYRAVMERDRG